LNAQTISSLIENETVVANIEPVKMFLRLGEKAVNSLEARAGVAKVGKPFFSTSL